jgi:hypothetical protein
MISMTALRGRRVRAKPTRRSKYGAKPVWVCKSVSCETFHGEGYLPLKDGSCRVCGSAELIRFPSRLEARRYAVLRQRERIGEIAELECQPEFTVSINGVHVLIYRADFGYRCIADGRRVVEDTKGKITALFTLKKRCVEAAYPGLKIEIVKAAAA